MRVGRSRTTLISELTIDSDVVMGGYKFTGLGEPEDQDDSLRKGRTEITNTEIADAAAIIYAKLSLALSLLIGDIKANQFNVANGLLKLNGNADVPLAQLKDLTNTEIAAAAGIVYTKLNLTGAVLLADIAAAELNAASKFLQLDAGAHVPLAQLSGLTDTEIAAAAAILESKLSLNFATHADAHEPSHKKGGADDIDEALDGRAVALTTQGDILYASAANTLARLAAGTAEKVLTTKGANQNPVWQTVATYTIAELMVY